MAQISMKEKLSYKLIGACYEVFNTLGFGHKEKIYQQALANWLASQDLKFQRELPFKLKFANKDVGSYRLDFLVENRIALELKVAVALHKRFINQLLNYLSETGKSLGLCVVFSPTGVIIKRVVNGQGHSEL